MLSSVSQILLFSTIPLPSFCGVFAPALVASHTLSGGTTQDSHSRFSVIRVVRYLIYSKRQRVSVTLPEFYAYAAPTVGKTLSSATTTPLNLHVL